MSDDGSVVTQSAENVQGDLTQGRKEKCIVKSEGRHIEGRRRKNKKGIN